MSHSINPEGSPASKRRLFSRKPKAAKPGEEEAADQADPRSLQDDEANDPNVSG
jgi:hypothetical protein